MALLPRARRILEQWDDARRAVAGAQDRILTVGFRTRISRGLIPAVTTAMDQMLPGWQLRFRQISWADPTVGLGAGDDVITRPVTGLPPSRLAVVWRAGDDREEVRVFVDASCRCG